LIWLNNINEITRKHININCKYENRKKIPSKNKYRNYQIRRKSHIKEYKIQQIKRGKILLKKEEAKIFRGPLKYKDV